MTMMMMIIVAGRGEDNLSSFYLQVMQHTGNRKSGEEDKREIETVDTGNDKTKWRQNIERSETQTLMHN